MGSIEAMKGAGTDRPNLRTRNAWLSTSPTKKDGFSPSVGWSRRNNPCKSKTRYPMSLETRRGFLAASGKLLIGTVALASMGARASDECEHKHAEHDHKHGHEHGGPGGDFAVDATLEDICATCRFWGGMRKLSDDGKKVMARSMGWCNNPDSPNHRKLTMADHRMRKADVWKKWAAL